MTNSDYLKTYWKTYQQRVKRVAVLLEPEQYALLSRKADAQGLKPATFARKVVEAELTREPVLPKAMEDELRTLIFLIRGIANNVNQMAHYSNLVKGLVNEKELLGELRKLEKTVQDYTLNRLKEKPTSDDH